MDQFSQKVVCKDVNQTYRNDECYSNTQKQQQSWNENATTDQNKNGNFFQKRTAETQYNERANTDVATEILTTNNVWKNSNNESFFIPQQAAKDDNKLKFILHPNLSLNGSVSATSSSVSWGNLPKSNYFSKTNKLFDALENKPGNVQHFIGTGTKSTNDTKLRKARRSLPSSAAFSSRSPTDKQSIEKSAKEILYDIAKGKWTHKNIVIDEEHDGTKKVGSRPCSNANCVKAQGRERRQHVQFASRNGMGMGSRMVFEDGNLPSYHSLLNLWNYQEEQQQRYTWLQGIFTHGHPRSENEFLTMWRECRKDPEAFGITISEPKELPEPENLRQGSKVRNVMKPYDKKLLVAKNLEKRPPVRLASTEYYQDWKPVKDSREREKQKSKYQKLRKLYPHLPALRDVDFKANPGTVKRRLKQAEEWHRLVITSNKPCPLTKSKIPPGTAESSELDFKASVDP